MTTELPNAISKPIRREITLKMFDESQCWAFLRFRLGDLERLYRCLRIPDVVRFENRTKMTGVEVFLRAMYELASGDSQYHICEHVFGRDQSQQFRAFGWFIEHVEEAFYDILSDNLEWFKREGFFEHSNRAITAKLADLGVAFTDDRPQVVAGFIDCNCLETCRVGGGPRSGVIYFI